MWYVGADDKYIALWRIRSSPESRMAPRRISLSGATFLRHSIGGHSSQNKSQAWGNAGLFWSFRAVITGKDAKYESIADLKDTTIGISRYGRCVYNLDF